MASLEASERAIVALNNTTPPGAVQSLIVRFAESAAEKAARLSRREAKNLQRTGSSGLPAMGLSGASLGLAPDQLSYTLSALNLGSVNALAGLPAATQLASAAAAVRPQLPPAPLVPQSYQPQVLSSICVKGIPPNADRLWCYGERVGVCGLLPWGAEVQARPRSMTHHHAARRKLCALWLGGRAAHPHRRELGAVQRHRVSCATAAAAGALRRARASAALRASLAHPAPTAAPTRAGLSTTRMRTLASARGSA